MEDERKKERKKESKKKKKTLLYECALIQNLLVNFIIPMDFPFKKSRCLGYFMVSVERGFGIVQDRQQ